MKKPELLLPAGDIKRLKVAITYGADALYLGGQRFNLRAGATNFTNEELKEATSYAHHFGKKIYFTLNNYLYDHEIKDLPTYIDFLKTLNLDAVIVSDLGVLKTIQELAPDLPLHLSTQASCLNSFSAKVWKSLGVERIVLGRECSLEEAAFIQDKAQIPVEIFIHGAMCMAYAGHCTLSSFTAGRDSNRGGCAHSCRFHYKLSPNLTGFPLSSKDLNGLALIPRIKELGITSLKIEGRMKSELYVATLARSYRAVLDGKSPLEVEEELHNVAHREYETGHLLAPAQKNSISFDSSHGKDLYRLIGTILEVKEKQHLLLEVRNSFTAKDHLEIVLPEGNSYKLSLEKIENVFGDTVLKTDPCTLIKLPYVEGIQAGYLVRKKEDSLP